MKRTDSDWLLDALQHLKALKRYLDSDVPDDDMVLDAAALRLSAAIESVSRISDKQRRRVMPDELWREIKGVRNRIAHAYGYTNPVELRAIVEGDVVAFEVDVRRMLEHESD